MRVEYLYKEKPSKRVDSANIYGRKGSVYLYLEEKRVGILQKKVLQGKDIMKVLQRLSIDFF